MSCFHVPYLGAQIGLCCNQVGGACQNDGECCDGYCVNGTCACIPDPAPGPLTCLTDGDCCAGSCFYAAPPLAGGYCYKTAGESCQNGYDCFADSCVDGSCSTCSPSHAYFAYGSEQDNNGRCNSQADCCSGLVCNQVQTYLLPPPAPSAYVYGDCCLPNGSSCVPAELNLDAGDCCSGDCDGGSCVCKRTGEQCNGDESCCTGACVAGWEVEAVCCQVVGDTCFSGADCCTGSCPDGQCACVPTGGACGPAGKLAQAGAAACCSGSCSTAGECQ